MWIEGVVCVVLVSVVLAGLLVRFGLPFSKSLTVAVVVAAALLLMTGNIWSRTGPFEAPTQSPDNRPIEEAAEGYVSSDTCARCHPHQYDTWHDSYHRTMTQLATPKSVFADFDGVELEDRGRVCRLEQRNDQYWIDMIDPAQPTRTGAPSRFREQVVMTTGSHHRQLYWFPSGQTRRLSLFPFAFLREEQRWIPRDAAFLTPPSPMPGVEFARWNTICIQCHTTHGRPGLVPGTGAHECDTRVAEFGISCESCHGEGQRHVQLNQSPSRRYQQHLAKTNDQHDDTIVNPAKLDTRRSSEVCGQCHSVFHLRQDHGDFNENGFAYRPGDELDPHKYVVRCGDPVKPRGMQRFGAAYYDERFWSDGMIRVSGREFNGLVESPCFQRGELSCLSCHQMHKSKDDPRALEEWTDDQLAIGMRENQACLQCHEEFRDGAALVNHTHHTDESSGSQCYNCHMPHTTYGMLKAIRSHQITSPTVSESLETGRPNACNHCHLDKTLSWTADHLHDWFDIDKPELDSDESEVAASILWLLRGEAGQRALVAWSYGWEPAKQASGTEWMAPYLGQLLVDPYDAIRFIAQRSLRRLPEQENLEYDFLGPRANRREALRVVLEEWMRRQSGEVRNSDRALLIDHDNRLMRQRFDHLLQQRDDRAMSLSE